MNKIILIGLMFCVCCANTGNTESSKAEKMPFEVSRQLNKSSSNNGVYGFAYIKLNEIYFRGGEIRIFKGSEEFIRILNKHFIINGVGFEIKEELSPDLIKCESFDPEYGIFIVRVLSEKNDKLTVEINGSECLISSEYYNYIELKTDEEHILQSYPVLGSNTPLREQPNDTAQTVQYFEEYSYVPIRIDGDWLYVRDDKDCPLRDSQSKVIEGWVRWRKDGKIIIRVAQLC